MELLSPAGNLESLIMAINNGADAVYLAGKSFGARAYANNFTNEELLEAIRLGKIYNVKIYVTMNTLVKESEVDSFLAQVEFLHKSGVDAIIMQDFGMIALCRSKYPNLEIHASTQANSASLEAIDLLYKMGVKRVVLPREMSIEDIKKIKTPIELEVFIHGALCVSYSGRCLMSYMLGGRSANRGACAGCCRLPYKLYDDKLIDSGYLLSMKELNLSEKIKDLDALGVASLKIEGRMKSPSYVGFITDYYRKIINNQKYDIDSLKILFNREFTLGRLYNSKDLINKTSPNHIGLKIGKVIDITKNKIKIRLDKTIYQEDGIRFLESNKGMVANFIYNEKGKLINSSKDIIYLDNKINLKTFDTVCKTTSKVLDNEIKNKNIKKMGVNFYLKAHINDNLELIVSDEFGNKITLKGNIVEKSITSPISKEKIVNLLSRINDTPFKINNIDIEMDENIFISVKEINELRRNIIDKLIEEKTKVKDIIINDVELEKTDNLSVNDIVLCNSKEDIIKNKGKVICTDNIELYKEFKDIYYNIPLNLLNIKLEDKCVLSEITSIDKNKDVISSYHNNVTNSYTAYYLYKLGYKAITLSIELDEQEIDLIKEKVKIPYLIYKSNIEVMTIKDNILNLENNKKYKLVSENNKFNVYYDGRLTHVLTQESIYK